ncbi:MAG: histidine kinase [Lachnospiraceae bacterium]|nr:histidine kinase [Lachnospiraceae bacterium]
MGKVATILLSFEIWGVILCIIAVICVCVTRNDKRASNKLIGLLLLDILMCFTEIVGIILREYALDDLSASIQVMRFLTFTISLILIARFANYVDYILNGHGLKQRKIFKNLVYIGCIFGFVFITLMHCLDISGFEKLQVYENGYFAQTYFVVLFFCFSVIFFQLFINRKSMKQAVFIGLTEMIIIPYLASVLQLFNYRVYFINIATTISYITLVAIYEVYYGRMLVEKEKRIQIEQQAFLQKEIEFGHERERLLSDQLSLEHEQVKLYNNQIKPHFIFNTLTAIRSKCEEGSEARKGIDSFATYLRGCVDMLVRTECVPIEREMTVVNSYIDIAGLRLGNEIKVVRNVEEISFTVPPFSIQSIVENAIKHGIRNKSGQNGTIWITIYRDENDDIVEIKDNGAGFDTKKLKDEKLWEEGHVGLANTIKRVETMCGGKVRIDSIIGEGTTVSMYFPINRKEFESVSAE